MGQNLGLLRRNVGCANMMRIDQGVRFDSLEELERYVASAVPGESVEMDRVQYAAYKTLVWQWLAKLNPISVFKGHPIVVIKRGE